MIWEDKMENSQPNFRKSRRISAVKVPRYVFYSISIVSLVFLFLGLQFSEIRIVSLVIIIGLLLITCGLLIFAIDHDKIENSEQG